MCQMHKLEANILYIVTKIQNTTKSSGFSIDKRRRVYYTVYTPPFWRTINCSKKII